MEKGDKIFTTKGQRYLSREDTESIGHEAKKYKAEGEKQPAELKTKSINRRSGSKSVTTLSPSHTRVQVVCQEEFLGGFLVVELLHLVMSSLNLLLKWLIKPALAYGSAIVQIKHQKTWLCSKFHDSQHLSCYRQFYMNIPSL